MIRKFFSRKKDDPDADIQRQAAEYAQIQQNSAKGNFATSKKNIACMSCDEKMQVDLIKRLTESTRSDGYFCLRDPSVEEAIESEVVIMDVRPWVDSRMHSKYDKVVRVKKSLGKFNRDLLCIVGPRSVAKRYSRGTYGTLYLFELPDEDSGLDNDDIPSEGLETVQGPVIFRYEDIGEVISGLLQNQDNSED